MLGILGLGSNSTLHYINQLNKKYNQKKGGFSTCPFVMYQVNFDLINPYLPNQFQELIPVVKKKVKELNELGVSHILIPNITLHETIDKIDFSTEIKNKLIHPLQLLQLVMASNNQSVIVLGTNYTMNSEYVSSFFSNNKGELTKEERAEIDWIRKDVYEFGVEEKQVNRLEKLIKKYPDYSFVIACTEISLVASEMEIEQNIIDLVELQLETILNKILI